MDEVLKNGFFLIILNFLIAIIVCIRVWRRYRPDMHPIYFVLCTMFRPHGWQWRPTANTDYRHPAVLEARAKILSEGVPVMILAYVLVYIWTHAYS
ncbi:hypothetical protein SAMN02927895_03736 [Belnapia rosea]|nr:hypothetical protein SAMN02927895_03736 [Belnapia rosea]